MVNIREETHGNTLPPHKDIFNRNGGEVFYTEICGSLGEDFRGIFLYSGMGSLEFRNQGYQDPTVHEPKIGHWDYIDSGFLTEEKKREVSLKYRKLFHDLGIQNPELLPESKVGWVPGFTEDTFNPAYWEHVTKRCKSMTFRNWFIGSKKPERIQYGSYDIGYAESSQVEPHITCTELVRLVRTGGYIVIRNSYYSGKHIASSLINGVEKGVEAILINPNQKFFLFQKRTGFIQ